MSNSFAFRNLWTCLIALLTLVPLASAGEPQWIEVHSPHFSVVTDGGEKRGRETAMRFEQMRAVFGTLMAKAKVNLPVPLQIVAFRNTRELRQFAPLWKGKPTEVSGLFQSGADRSFIMLDLSVEDPWAVVFHEYAHQLIEGNLATQMDPWFEEGFAEYFSSIEVDNKQARIGKIPHEDYVILQQDGMMKVADLFRVRQNSRTYNESGDHRTVFYAESSMIVHYIYDNQLIPKLGAYFDLADKQNVPIDEAVQKAFGMSPAQFDKVLRNYVSSGHFRYFALPTPAGIVSTAYAVAPMSAEDARATLADIHLHSLDYQDKAVNEFEAVLAADPNNAAALRGLGYAALRKRDFQHAGDYFRRAVQADSKDPRVYYYSALLVNQEESMTRDPDKLSTMKTDLEKSIALDPEFADSYALLAYAHMVSGEHDDAIASLKKAIELSPRNEQYLFNLSQMYVAQGNVQEATAVLGPLASSSNPEVAARARESIEQIKKMQIVLQATEHPATVLVPAAAPESNAAPTIAVKEEAAAAHPITASAPPKFLKGQLVSVDCSHAPGAVLTVRSGAKTLKMSVADTKHAIVIGADDFSCGWTQKPVAVNYRVSSDGEMKVMTVEIQ
jgi:cytochrome c-type biogenesis protein CcmH/NrfG